jgi:hypothetical protein
MFPLGRGRLPIVQSSTFELIINLTAAKALSIAVPPSVLVSDRVRRRKFLTAS